METVSIKGLNKAAVFVALFNKAKPLGLGFLQYEPTPMTEEQAEERFDFETDYFDYVDGRVMKVDLSGDEFRSGSYDRDNGVSAASTIIKQLREAPK